MDLKGFAVLDVETTIATYMKRKASVFYDNNWIVAAAYIGVDGVVVEDYWGRDKEGSKGWLVKLLATNPKFLVGFNIKFDMLWLIKFQEDYEAFQDWVAAGGQLWDCQLGEYLLDGMIQESHMLSLDEVAVRYGGDLKIDEVKAYWSQGISTEDIPRDLLMDYLSGREDDEGKLHPGDIQNTKTVFLGQTAAARKSGQTVSIQLNNGALVATIEMERNGLYVNKEKALAIAAELREEIAQLQQDLTKYLPEGLPFTFKWTSRKQLSAFIFGGRVTYPQRVHQVDEAGKPAYAMKDEVHYLLAGGTTMECSWWEHCYNTEHGFADSEAMTRVEYLSGKSKGMPKTKKVKVPDPSRPKMKIEEFHYTFPGLTKPRAEWAGAEPGVYSTAGEVIEELGLTTDIPFLLAFSNLQAKTKDLGTYYIQTEYDAEGNVKKEKGMLTLVQPDGIVHHKVNMTSTVTARFSHTDPNAGNLPRGDDNSASGGHTSRVKENFESRFGETGKIIVSDFTSLEVYCQANLSKDSQLVNDLLAGLDMHCARLAAVEKRDYHEVLLLAKGDKTKGVAADPAWAMKRTYIKTYSFQRAFGAGAKKIAAFLKVPVEEVEQWIAADDARYPGIPLFNAKVEAFVKAHTVPTDKWVVHPSTRQNLRLNRGYLKTFDGKKYCFIEGPSPEYVAKRGTLQSFSPTELKNYPVQGLGGEWMKAAMWNAVRAFYARRNFGGKALLINTVHDALYADSADEVARDAGACIHAAMQGASDLIEYLFDHTLEVPVPSETTYGPNMADEVHYPDNAGFEALAQTYRTDMRNTWMGGFTPSYLQ